MVILILSYIQVPNLACAAVYAAKVAEHYCEILNYPAYFTTSCGFYLTFTYADTGTQPATSLQNPSAVAIAQRNNRKIEGKFSKLLTKSRKKLQSREIDVEDVQEFLIAMYSSPNSRDGSDTVTTVLESARSLDEIFRALSKHGLLDYLNYYPLGNFSN